MKNIETYEKIIRELAKFKFTRSSIAYQYLIESIYIVCNDDLTIKNFKENVYLKVAKKYDTKSDNVIWCISKALKIMYLNTEESILKEYFLMVYYESVTPKSFIIYIAHKINERNLCSKMSKSVS